MSEADNGRLNWSTLRHMATSPKMLQWRRDNPQKDTDALIQGRAVHCAVLEPDEFDKRWVAPTQCGATKKGGAQCTNPGSIYFGYQWFCGVKSHAPITKDQQTLPEGMEIISAEGREIALKCAQAVRDHPRAFALLQEGKPEVELEWAHKETGTLCRGRLDWVKALGIADLKSTRHETLGQIMADAGRRLYHANLAWYHDGGIAAGAIPENATLPKIVVVQNVEPYDVVVLQLSRTTYDAGHICYRDLLLRYKQCQAADWWPGFGPDVIQWELKLWALGMAGPEEEG